MTWPSRFLRIVNFTFPSLRCFNQQQPGNFWQFLARVLLVTSFICFSAETSMQSQIDRTVGSRITPRSGKVPTMTNAVIRRVFDLSQPSLTSKYMLPISSLPMQISTRATVVVLCIMGWLIVDFIFSHSWSSRRSQYYSHALWICLQSFSNLGSHRQREKFLDLFFSIRISSSKERGSCYSLGNKCPFILLTSSRIESVAVSLTYWFWSVRQSIL